MHELGLNELKFSNPSESYAPRSPCWTIVLQQNNPNVFQLKGDAHMNKQKARNINPLSYHNNNTTSSAPDQMYTLQMEMDL